MKAAQLSDEIHMKGRYRFTIRDAATGAIKRTYEYENVVPLVGRTAVAKALSDGSSLQVNYGAVGTGTTSPASGDTQLETEVFRKVIAGAEYASNLLYVTAFFGATETSGTYKEAGIFIGGTSTANSGTLISRVAIDITKTSVETLTLDWTLTIS